MFGFIELWIEMPAADGGAWSFEVDHRAVSTSPQTLAARLYKIRIPASNV
jgi:hypothetical protein